MKFAVVFVCVVSVAFSMPTTSDPDSSSRRPEAFAADIDTTRYTIGLNQTTTTTTPVPTEAPTTESTTEASESATGTTGESVVIEPNEHASDESGKDNQQSNKTSDLVDLNIGLLKNIALTNQIKSQVAQQAKSGTSLLKGLPLGQVTDKLGALGAAELVNGLTDKAGSATGQKQVSQTAQNTVNDLLDIALNGNSLLALPGVGK